MQGSDQAVDKDHSIMPVHGWIVSNVAGEEALLQGRDSKPAAKSAFMQSRPEILGSLITRLPQASQSVPQGWVSGPPVTQQCTRV
jgi:hypothetical protein